METNSFNDLLASATEAKEILKGRKKPSRSFTIEEPDAKAIRKNMNLTQDEFAGLLNISVGTLRNWEQSRRRPDGPARVLLGIVAEHPEILTQR